MGALQWCDRGGDTRKLSHPACDVCGNHVEYVIQARYSGVPMGNAMCFACFNRLFEKCKKICQLQRMERSDSRCLSR